MKKKEYINEIYSEIISGGTKTLYFDADYLAYFEFRGKYIDVDAVSVYNGLLEMHIDGEQENKWHKVTERITKRGLDEILGSVLHALDY